MSTSKAQLIDAMAKEADLSKAKAKQAIELTLWAISDALAKGEDVTLIGFGTFKISELAARTGRNPQTGKAMQIKAKKVVRFKAGAALATSVK